MTANIDRLRAMLTSEQFDEVCQRALERVLATEPDTIARELPAIADGLRAEGFAEDQISHGIETFAAAAGLNRNRGYN